MIDILETICTRVLLNDGAMGTQLQAAGLEPGESGDIWNVSHPDKVLKIQRAYVEAGSDCLTTNSFRANPIVLEPMGLLDRFEEINTKSGEIARAAFAGKPGFVLGDLGPIGALLEPYGTITEAEAAAAFRRQASVLIRAGVDAILIETMTVLEELEIAIRESLAAGARCVIASMAFDVTRDGSDVRTMMGVPPERAAEAMQRAGAQVAGTNCGSGVDIRWAARILERFRSGCDLPLMAQPNAGLPRIDGDRIVYDNDPKAMAEGVPALIAAGAGIIGSCCGSGPANIREFRRVLDSIG